MYSPVSACQVAGCLKNLVCVLNICVQYTCIMFEAAWVSVVLVPLLVRKSRWSQEWCSGVYRQNHCRDKTNSQIRHQVRHLETATVGMGCHLIWQSHSLQMKASSLKLGCLPNTWTTWEEKEAHDPPGHLAVDEPYQCGEAHTAPAEVEDSWGLWCIARLTRLSLFALQVYFTCNSHSGRCFGILPLSLSVWPCKFISPASFLLAKVKADTVQAAVAEAEEAADCEQCLQKEMQRQEESKGVERIGAVV